MAIVAACLFAARYFAIAAIAYQLSFLLDCLDGKIATLRGKRHDWGAWFDQAGDAVRVTACSAGLAFGLASAGFDAPWQVMLLVLYPSLRWSVVMLVGGRPAIPASPAPTSSQGPSETPTETHIDLPGRVLDVLRSAPRRRLRPGSTVDTEAVAFTLGPLLTFPFIGIVFASAVDALHIAYLVAAGIRGAMRRDRYAD